MNERVIVMYVVAVVVVVVVVVVIVVSGGNVWGDTPETIEVLLSISTRFFRSSCFRLPASREIILHSREAC